MTSPAGDRAELTRQQEGRWSLCRGYLSEKAKGVLSECLGVWSSSLQRANGVEIG